MKKVLFIHLLILAGCYHLISQTILQLPNHIYNQNVYNPGATSTGLTDISMGLISRFQFASLDGSPRLYEAWGDYKLKKYQSGIGVNIKKETYGANELNDVSVSYAYHLMISKKAKLGFGLRLGYLFGKFNPSKLSQVFDEDDPLLAEANQVNTPKLGAGLKLYNEKYFVGISVPDLYLSKFNYSNMDSTGNPGKGSFVDKTRNLVLAASYKLAINDLYYLQPSLLFQRVSGVGTKIEPNLNFGLNNYFWLGAGYSSIGNLSFNAGAQISPKMRFAYVFEYPMNLRDGQTKIKASAFNSHSINLLINMDSFLK